MASPMKDTEDSRSRSRSPEPKKNDSRSKSASRSRSRSRSPAARRDDREGDKKSERDEEGADRDDRRGDGEKAPRSRSRSPLAAADNDGNHLYIANLSYKTRETDLNDIFSKFGKLQRCSLIVDPITRDSRGFGFISFEDSRDAADAIKELNGKDIDGRNIRIELSKRTSGHPKTPGKYLGPNGASSRYKERRGRDGHEDRGGRDRDYDRRDRYDDRRGGRDRGYERRDYDRRDRDRYDDHRSHGRGRDRR